MSSSSTPSSNAIKLALDDLEPPAPTTPSPGILRLTQARERQLAQALRAAEQAALEVRQMLDEHTAKCATHANVERDELMESTEAVCDVTHSDIYGTSSEDGESELRSSVYLTASGGLDGSHSSQPRTVTFESFDSERYSDRSLSAHASKKRVVDAPVGPFPVVTPVATKTRIVAPLKSAMKISERISKPSPVQTEPASERALSRRAKRRAAAAARKAAQPAVASAIVVKPKAAKTGLLPTPQSTPPALPPRDDNSSPPVGEAEPAVPAQQPVERLAPGPPPHVVAKEAAARAALSEAAEQRQRAQVATLPKEAGELAAHAPKAKRVHRIDSRIPSDLQAEITDMVRGVFTPLPEAGSGSNPHLAMAEARGAQRRVLIDRGLILKHAGFRDNDPEVRLIVVAPSTQMAMSGMNASMMMPSLGKAPPMRGVWNPNCITCECLIDERGLCGHMLIWLQQTAGSRVVVYMHDVHFNLPSAHLVGILRHADAVVIAGLAMKNLPFSNLGFEGSDFTLRKLVPGSGTYGQWYHPYLLDGGTHRFQISGGEMVAHFDCRDYWPVSDRMLCVMRKGTVAGMVVTDYPEFFKLRDDATAYCYGSNMVISYEDMRIAMPRAEFNEGVKGLTTILLSAPDDALRQRNWASQYVKSVPEDCYAHVFRLLVAYKLQQAAEASRVSEDTIGVRLIPPAMAAMSARSRAGVWWDGVTRGFWDLVSPTVFARRYTWLESCLLFILLVAFSRYIALFAVAFVGFKSMQNVTGPVRFVGAAALAFALMVMMAPMASAGYTNGSAGSRHAEYYPATLAEVAAANVSAYGTDYYNNYPQDLRAKSEPRAAEPESVAPAAEVLPSFPFMEYLDQVPNMITEYEMYLLPAMLVPLLYTMVSYNMRAGRMRIVHRWQSVAAGLIATVVMNVLTPLLSPFQWIYIAFGALFCLLCGMSVRGERAGVWPSALEALDNFVAPFLADQPRDVSFLVRSLIATVADAILIVPFAALYFIAHLLNAAYLCIPRYQVVFAFWATGFIYGVYSEPIVCSEVYCGADAVCLYLDGALAGSAFPGTQRTIPTVRAYGICIAEQRAFSEYAADLTVPRPLVTTLDKVEAHPRSHGRVGGVFLTNTTRHHIPLQAASCDHNVVGALHLRFCNIRREAASEDAVAAVIASDWFKRVLECSVLAGQEVGFNWMTEELEVAYEAHLRTRGTYAQRVQMQNADSQRLTAKIHNKTDERLLCGNTKVLKPRPIIASSSRTMLLFNGPTYNYTKLFLRFMNEAQETAGVTGKYVRTYMKFAFDGVEGGARLFERWLKAMDLLAAIRSRIPSLDWVIAYLAYDAAAADGSWQRLTRLFAKVPGVAAGLYPAAFLRKAAAGLTKFADAIDEMPERYVSDIGEACRVLVSTGAGSMLNRTRTVFARVPWIMQSGSAETSIDTTFITAAIFERARQLFSFRVPAIALPGVKQAWDELVDYVQGDDSDALWIVPRQCLASVDECVYAAAGELGFLFTGHAGIIEGLPTYEMCSHLALPAFVQQPDGSARATFVLGRKIGRAICMMCATDARHGRRGALRVLKQRLLDGLWDDVHNLLLTVFYRALLESPEFVGIEGKAYKRHEYHIGIPDDAVVLGDKDRYIEYVCARYGWSTAVYHSAEAELSNYRIGDVIQGTHAEDLIRVDCA